MKKVRVISAIILISISTFISCKKHYECSCHTSTGAHKHIEIEAKKANAESDCKAKAVGTYTVCSLE